MSLGTTTRSLTKGAKKRFPGADDADIREFVLLQVRVALEHPSSRTTDEDLAKFTDTAYNEAVENGEAWAVSLKNSIRDSIIKPLVEKARAKGVDPVAGVLMATDLSEAEVRSLVESLDADEADNFNGDPQATEDGEGDEAPAPVAAAASY